MPFVNVLKLKEIYVDVKPDVTISAPNLQLDYLKNPVDDNQNMKRKVKSDGNKK